MRTAPVPMLLSLQLQGVCGKESLIGVLEDVNNGFFWFSIKS